MAYKLFSDKQEIFECKLQLEGASLSKSKARILLETTEGTILLFKGKINSSGKCTIKIPKLKNKIEETSGKMKLEVIAEDTYFEPWEDNFIIEQSKKLTVEVKEQSDKIIKDNKPKIKVITERKTTDYVEYLIEYLKRNNITPKNIIKHKSMINKYLNKFNINNKHKVITEIVYKLDK